MDAGTVEDITVVTTVGGISIFVTAFIAEGDGKIAEGGIN